MRNGLNAERQPMNDQKMLAYMGVMESVSFREDDTLIGVSINRSIRVSAGRVLVIELPAESDARWRLIRAVCKALERESEADKEQQ